MGKEKTIKDGTHTSPRYVTSGYPLVTSKNLSAGGLDLNNVSYITKEDFQNINKRSEVSKNDIIFGMIGTIGNPVLLEKSGFAIKNVALLKNDGKINNFWLIQYLKSTVFKKSIFKRTAGNTQKFIGLSLIRNLVVSVPNAHEQNDIGKLLCEADNLIAANQCQQKARIPLISGLLYQLSNQTS